jgi:hypothetical protein
MQEKVARVKRSEDPRFTHAISLIRAVIDEQAVAAATNGTSAQRVEDLTKELARDRKYTITIMLAVLNDAPAPVKVFSPWMSYPIINKHERAGKITLTRKNGKILLRASEFFELLNRLPEDKRRSKSKKPGSLEGGK